MGKRTAVFLAIGFVISLIEFTVWMVGRVAWVDFFHHNPNRSQANALVMIVLSPLYGLVDTLLLAALPVIAGAILIAVIIQIRGWLPFWALLGIGPMSAIAFVVQNRLIFPPDLMLPVNAITLAKCIFAQVPVLLGCWLFARETRWGSRHHRP